LLLLRVEAWPDVLDDLGAFFDHAAQSNILAKRIIEDGRRTVALKGRRAPRI
jgi:hypothetical protein